MNSSHKGQWRGASIFSLICVWINGWLNSREAGDLRRYRAHYDVSVMYSSWLAHWSMIKPVCFKSSLIQRKAYRQNIIWTNGDLFSNKQYRNIFSTYLKMLINEVYSFSHARISCGFQNQSSLASFSLHHYQIKQHLIGYRYHYISIHTRRHAIQTLSLLLSIRDGNPPGPRFNIKMQSCQYRKSHCGDKTVVRSSYLHNGNR